MLIGELSVLGGILSQTSSGLGNGLFEGTLFLISIIAGFMGALFGLGGGMILIPILTLIFGIHIRYAAGASLLSVIATSSGSGAGYVRDRLTNIRVAVLLEVATSIGALAGVYLAAQVSGRILYALFGLTLLASCLNMLRRRKELVFFDRSSHPLQLSHPWAVRLKLDSSYPDAFLKKEIAYQVQGVPLSLGLMAGAGLLSGMLGIGSGSLKVPAMDRAMKLPLKVSSATSNFMMGVTAAASAGIYYMRGDILPYLAAPVASGVLLGSWLGARKMSGVSESSLRKVFILLLGFTALQMLFKAWNSS